MLCKNVLVSILILYLWMFLCGAYLCDFDGISQREVLEDFYNATGGNNWRNNSGWWSGSDVCNWYGISCTEGRVSFMLLTRNNLVGTIPPSLGALPALRYIDLSYNHLSSIIPDEITCLFDLNILKFSGNMRLNSTIPETIGNLTRLQIFDVSFNSLTGTIPDSISSCSLLRNFLVQYNSLSGPIPESFYDLTSLTKVDMGYNLLSGNISSNISELKNLETFQMPRNSLTGSIPNSIGYINSLLELNLEYNVIEGTIPVDLCSANQLERLILAGNRLEGVLPSCLSTMVRLTELDLSRNDLSGTVESLASVKLELLDLSTNSFSGDLPNLSSLASIQFIDFSANQFSGSLPDTLQNGRFAYMRSFDASSNNLGGTLPDWIGNVMDVSLFLTNNEFICPYPSDIPLNVHVDTHCVSGIWYQGLFVVVAILLEFFGFIVTVVGLTITLAYLYRPSLLESFGPDSYEEELNKDRLQNRSDWLLRSRNFLLGGCVLELQVSSLLLLVGIVMCYNAESQPFYSAWFLISIPVTAVIFMLKTILVIIFGIRTWQTGLLGAPVVSQLAQSVFIVWAFTLEGVQQANAVSLCVIAIIVLDIVCNLLGILEAYLIQDQFIPLHQLILDDTLKDSEGAFGEVRHGTYLGIDIAAKRAKPRSSLERKEVYKAFLKEAKILSELGHHSNIVKLIGVSPMLEQEFYIVMEYCDGGTALQYLRKIHEDQTDAQFYHTIIKLCMGVCDAMHYFHSKGYTHRDITASNIMVKRGRAMLGDMGLARRIRKNRITSDSIDKNTKYVPRYNKLFGAPELATKGTKYSKQCDVFCFGVALWEMCMLRKWSVHDLERGYASCIQDLQDNNPILAGIVSRCWHEEPSFRPSFAELLEEFSRLNHEELSSYRTIE